MAGLDRSPRTSPGLVASAMLIVGACSSSAPKPLESPTGTSASAPQLTPEETPAVEQTAADPEEELAAAPRETAEEAPQPEPGDESEVLIDTGAKDVTEQRQSLAETARAERERRQVAEPTDIVITDKNLAEYATGDLTTGEVPAKQGAGSSGASELQSEMAAKEVYWSGRVREIRQAWRDAYDKIPALEDKVFQLRQAFYREDDGFYRDGEIKPAWDRAIDQLEEARLEVEARQAELAVVLEEGRGAGALPGWLRAGIDLEPDTEAVEDPTVEPSEPVIYQQEARDPP